MSSKDTQDNAIYDTIKKQIHISKQRAQTTRQQRKQSAHVIASELKELAKSQD
jgi:hypothetical protein